MEGLNNLARSGADTGVAIARQLGAKLPHELTEAEAVLRELARIAAEPAPPPPPVPTDPAKIMAALTKQATAVDLHDRIKAAAADASGPALARFIAAYRTIQPLAVEHLAEQFAQAWATFTKAAPVAPGTLGAYANDEQVQAYMTVTRTADQLDQLAGWRVDLGLSIGEAAASLGNVFLVADPPLIDPDPALFEDKWQRVFHTIRDWPNFSGVDKWRTLVASGFEVSLAGPGDLDVRQEHLNRWHTANGALHSQGGAAAFRDGMARGGFSGLAAAQETADRAHTDQVRREQAERDAKAATARQEVDAADRAEFLAQQRN